MDCKTSISSSTAAIISSFNTQSGLWTYEIPARRQYNLARWTKMYDNAAEKVDEIAERILMPGGTPANQFSDYLRVANTNEVDKVSNGNEQALNNILQSTGYLIGEERKVLSIASQAGDEMTVSMMSDCLSICATELRLD